MRIPKKTLKSNSIGTLWFMCLYAYCEIYKCVMRLGLA
jgi:hypothetical protein